MALSFTVHSATWQHGNALSRRWEQAMEEAGVPPDVSTLNAVLGVLRRARQPDLVLPLMAHMQSV